MAATHRATTPHTEPFPPLEGLRTPTSLASGANPLTTNAAGAENRNLLAPHSAQKSIADISPRSEKLGYSPGTTTVTLTGAAAMADLKKRKQQKAAEEMNSRQKSPNPAVEAMQSLMGNGGMSKPSDAPAPGKLSEPLRKAAEKINIPENATASGESLQISPVSLGSFSSVENTTAKSGMTATANHDSGAAGAQLVAEPAEMTGGGSYSSHLAVAAAGAGDDGQKASSFSYPGPPPQQQEETQEGGPSRGMSFPGVQDSSPKSPASNKRHKCPYCSTDFTRHHNLKSHLLTHSQEKPYVCQTCQARFRRLHDLKRHTKLHTGERPHTCDKCGRRFARGDALARHNKGPGGCAGRRSSFGGDDEFGDGAGPDHMDGVEYTGGDEDEEGGTDSQGRRVSEPSRKRAHHETQQDPQRQVYRQHSSTYPPVGPVPTGRPHGASVSNMGPPQVVHPGSGNVASPRDMSGHLSPAGGSMGGSYPPPPYPSGGAVFSHQGGMVVESPKPLSPGQPPDQHRLSVDAAMHGQNRNRSPSLTTQFQQAHFGRGSGRGTPPYPPTGSQLPGAQQTPQHSGAHVLPPLSAGQPPARPGHPTSYTSGGHGPSMLHHQQLPPGTQGSQPGSLSSHGQSSGSSARDILGQDSGDIWAFVRQLEQRFSRMQDEYELRISRLQEEVISLKGQVSQQNSYSSEMNRPY